MYCFLKDITIFKKQHCINAIIFLYIIYNIYKLVLIKILQSKRPEVLNVLIFFFTMFEI